MTKPWSIALAALLSAAAYGEVISGPAVVLDKPYGQVLFTLQDGVKVQATAEENHHQRIQFAGVVKADEFWGRDRLKKRQPIYGLDGECIGGTIRQVDLPLGKLDQDGGRYVAAFTGYVAETSIDRTTEVEHALEPIVDRKLHPLSVDDLKSHLTKFGYKKCVSIDGLETYVYRDSWEDTTRPAPRLALVFRANQFVAVIAKRDIHFIAHDPVLIRDGYTLTYVEPVAKKVAAKIEKDLAKALVNS